MATTQPEATSLRPEPPADEREREPSQAAADILQSLPELAALRQSQDGEPDARSTKSAEDDEDLMTIKAKTMFKMVEELHGSTADQSRKLLWLSTRQADLIASDAQSLGRMLEIGFEVTIPFASVPQSPTLSCCIAR